MGQVFGSIKNYLVLALYIIEHVYFSWGLENIHQALKSPAIWDEDPLLKTIEMHYTCTSMMLT